MIKVVSRESRIALASGMNSIVVVAVVVHVAVMISIHILLLRIDSAAILDITHIVHIAIPMVVCDWSGILILMIKHSAH